MTLFVHEPEIKIGKDGFDKFNSLGRKDFGDQLSALLSAIDDPVVVAIDGSWGSGKTVFLKCWVGEHLKRAQNNDQVIYFDAFQHDYMDDPLIALVSEIAATKGNRKGGKLSKLKKAAVALARPATRIALTLATKGVSQVAGALGEAAAKATADELANSAEAFWKKEDGRRTAMDEFRDALTEMAQSTDGGKLIFVIDELDRCRPDYALSLLETIKHFFAVDNVHFVLGVNLAELKNTVQARYGMGTAADAYLDKFIHLRAALPDRVGPRAEDRAGLVHFENIAEEMGIQKNIYDNIIRYLHLRKSAPSLREVERLASLVAMVPPTVEDRGIGYRVVILGAAVLKALDPNTYVRILDGTATFVDVTHALSLSVGKGGQIADSRSAKYYATAWAGFKDLAVWAASDDQMKSGMFQLECPLERDVQLSDTIADYLETFQLPAPAQ